MKKIIKILAIILIVLLLIFSAGLAKNVLLKHLITSEHAPEFTINDLYKSNEINYRLLLNKKEKRIYEELLTNFIEFNQTFTIDMSDFDYKNSYGCFEKIFDITHLIAMDHPELIHVGGVSANKLKTSSSVTVNATYVMSQSEYEKNIEEIKKYINDVKNATANLDEYSKVKYVYDYLGNKNTYGEPSDYMGQSAYSAFNDNLSPVCAGYSKAAQILFQNININSLLVFGDSNYALFLGDAHAWNNVEIEGKFYLFDVTYSSGGQGIDKMFYQGFLIKSDKNHLPWYKQTSAYLNGKKYINKNS